MIAFRLVDSKVLSDWFAWRTNDMRKSRAIYIGIWKMTVNLTFLKILFRLFYICLWFFILISCLWFSFEVHPVLVKWKSGALCSRTMSDQMAAQLNLWRHYVIMWLSHVTCYKQALPRPRSVMDEVSPVRKIGRRTFRCPNVSFSKNRVIYLIRISMIFGFNFIGPRNRTHLIRLCISVQKQMESDQFSRFSPSMTPFDDFLQKCTDFNINKASSELQSEKCNLTGCNENLLTESWESEPEGFHMRFGRFNMFPLPDFFRKTKKGIPIWPSERPWNEKLFDTVVIKSPSHIWFPSNAEQPKWRYLDQGITDLTG